MHFRYWVSVSVPTRRRPPSRSRLANRANPSVRTVLTGANADVFNEDGQPPAVRPVASEVTITRRRIQDKPHDQRHRNQHRPYLCRHPPEISRCHVSTTHSRHAASNRAEGPQCDSPAWRAGSLVRPVIPSPVMASPPCPNLSSTSSPTLRVFSPGTNLPRMTRQLSKRTIGSKPAP